MVEKRAHLDPKDAPHAGLHILAQGTGAVQIIPGTVGSAAQQLQIVDVAYADVPLHCFHVGQRVFRLFPPYMAVDQKARVSGFIPGHQIADDDPFLGIGGQHRGGRISMDLGIKELVNQRDLI